MYLIIMFVLLTGSLYFVEHYIDAEMKDATHEGSYTCERQENRERVILESKCVGNVNS